MAEKIIMRGERKEGGSLAEGGPTKNHQWADPLSALSDRDNLLRLKCDNLHALADFFQGTIYLGSKCRLKFQGTFGIR